MKKIVLFISTLIILILFIIIKQNYLNNILYCHNIEYDNYNNPSEGRAILNGYYIQKTVRGGYSDFDGITYDDMTCDSFVTVSGCTKIFHREIEYNSKIYKIRDLDMEEYSDLQQKNIKESTPDNLTTIEHHIEPLPYSDVYYERCDGLGEYKF